MPPISLSCLERKVIQLAEHPDAEVYVYELGGSILGLISIHFVPQLEIEEDIARICYFVVDGHCRHKGIGKEMEAFCEALAHQRKCNRIEVHCQERRKEAHWFYLELGYEISPKYLVKALKNDRDICVCSEVYFKHLYCHICRETFNDERIFEYNRFNA
ncbi:MAG: GNAT family N-acetyltransferase [Bacteroidota bacterium]|nr:GNAT family N-acetyltransferase [Bacteroidota bacterium]